MVVWHHPPQRSQLQPLHLAARFVHHGAGVVRIACSPAFRRGFFFSPAHVVINAIGIIGMINSEMASIGSMGMITMM